VSSQLSMYSCHTNPYKWNSVYTSSCSEYNGRKKNPAPARKRNHKFQYATSHFVWLPPFPFPVTSELSCRTFSKLSFYGALSQVILLSVKFLRLQSLCVLPPRLMHLIRLQNLVSGDITFLNCI